MSWTRINDKWQMKNDRIEVGTIFSQKIYFYYFLLGDTELIRHEEWKIIFEDEQKIKNHKSDRIEVGMILEKTYFFSSSK